MFLFFYMIRSEGVCFWRGLLLSKGWANLQYLTWVPGEWARGQRPEQAAPWFSSFGGPRKRFHLFGVWCTVLWISTGVRGSVLMRAVIIWRGGWTYKCYQSPPENVNQGAAHLKMEWASHMKMERAAPWYSFFGGPLCFIHGQWLAFDTFVLLYFNQDVDPVAKLENFRGLKLCRLGNFRVLKP